MGISKVTWFAIVVGAMLTPLATVVVASPSAARASLVAEISEAPADIRQALLGERDRLRDFLIGRMVDRALEQHAVVTGLDQDERVKHTLERIRRDELVRAVLRKITEDFREEMPDMSGLAHNYYLANQAQYALPEAIRVAHILVRIDPETMDTEELERRRELAHKLRERVLAGEDFASLADRYSDDTGTARRGGLLRDFVERNVLVPPFEDAAFALEVGQISDLVRTRFGYHIIMLLERRPPGTRPFEEVRREIVAKLEKEWLDPRREAFLDQFRDEALMRQVEQLEEELRAHFGSLQ